MRFLRQNTAVRITVGPFLDHADGLTPLNAITTVADIVGAINYDDDDNTATHAIHFHPAASGSDNDMVAVGADGAGLWDLELTQANTNYTGRMILSLTDPLQICPVFHEFTVLAANVYDSLFAGAGLTADLLDVSAAQWGGTAVASVTLPANMTQINSTSIAGTSTQIAAAFVAQYNVASPVFTNQSANQTATAAALTNDSIAEATMTRLKDLTVTGADGVEYSIIT